MIYVVTVCMRHSRLHSIGQDLLPRTYLHSMSLQPCLCLPMSPMPSFGTIHHPCPVACTALPPPSTRPMTPVTILTVGDAIILHFLALTSCALDMLPALPLFFIVHYFPVFYLLNAISKMLASISMLCPPFFIARHFQRSTCSMRCRRMSTNHMCAILLPSPLVCSWILTSSLTRQLVARWKRCFCVVNCLSGWQGAIRYHASQKEHALQANAWNPTTQRHVCNR